MYDTLMYVKKLEAVGVPRNQAEAQVEIMSQIVDSNFATKQDLKDLATALRSEMNEGTSALRLEMRETASSLRLEMKQITVNTGKMFIAAVTIMIAAMGLMLKF